MAERGLDWVMDGYQDGSMKPLVELMYTLSSHNMSIMFIGDSLNVQFQYAFKQELKRENIGNLFIVLISLLVSNTLYYEGGKFFHYCNDDFAETVGLYKGRNIVRYLLIVFYSEQSKISYFQHMYHDHISEPLSHGLRMLALAYG